MTGLRERRHEQTRRALVDAAFALFAESGYSDVTMNEIARAAGVSRSTAYRRFPTKEDVVLDVPRRWLAVFDQALAEHEDHGNLRSAMRACCRAVARHIDSEPGVVLAAYAVLDEAPTMQSSGVADQAWLDRIVELVTGRSDLDTAAAQIIAGAYLGALDAMMQRWAADGGTAAVVDATEQLLDRLEPILP